MKQRIPLFEAFINEVTKTMTLQQFLIIALGTADKNKQIDLFYDELHASKTSGYGYSGRLTKDLITTLYDKYKESKLEFWCHKQDSFAIKNDSALPYVTEFVLDDLEVYWGSNKKIC